MMIKGSLKDRITFMFPSNWSISNLKNITSDVIDNRGKTPPLDEDGEHPLLEIFNMQDDSLNIKIQEKQKYVSKETYETWFRNGHPKFGDVLVSTVGHVGVVSYYDKNNYCIAQNLVALRIDEEKAYSKFIAYYMNSALFKKWVKGVTMHAVQPSLKVPHLLEGSIPLPRLQEQQKIATILSSVDEAIEKTEQIIEQTETVKKGLMQQLLRKGIEHTEFQDSQIGKIPLSWDLFYLDDIAFLRKEKYNPKTETDELKYIGLDHINQGTGTINSYGNSLETKSMKNMFYKEDVLFGKLRPYLKKYWYAEFEGVCGTEILPIVAKENVLPKYLFYLFQQDYFLEEISSKTFGTRMPRTSWNDMKVFQFPLPNLDEQQAIINIIEEFDNKMNIELDKLEALSTIKKGLMQQLLTGKVRVLINENEEVPT